MERTTAGASEPWRGRKKDDAPRGVFRHPSGVWAVRFKCGGGCRKHEERVGPLKSEAIRVYHARRARALDEPGWCPDVERRQAKDRARIERQRQRARMTFAEYGREFIAWAKVHHRSWAKDDSRLSRVLPVLGTKKLDEISTADIERLLASLREGERALSPASVNRYRDLISGMFKRAIRLGLVAANPVRGIPKLRETGGRVVYLTPEEEQAIREALPSDLRPLFAVSVHTGLRWSEQAGLRWRDIDMLAGVMTVSHSKNGHTRQVPMNSAVRSVLFDLAARRERPDDPGESVFGAAYRTTARLFEKAVQRAQAALRDAGKDAGRLDGYTWHGNRHTFASRLVMAGVDPRTVQELGGWKTLAMVQRYTHLAPSRLADAVERLVVSNAGEVRQKFHSTQDASVLVTPGVS
jgi:site-specific recombinase XerD